MSKSRAVFTVDQQGMAKALTGPQGEATLLVARAARQVENSAKMKSPVDKGVLRNSISADPSPKVSGLKVTSGVTASANYAMAVHEGVKGGKIITPKAGSYALAYRSGAIRPGTARALAFQIGGRTVFAASVKQGAQKARPFLRNAATETAGRLGFKVSDVP